MKKLICVLCFAIYSVSAFAGVARFSARYVVKPAAKNSAKVLAYSAKKAARGAKKTAKAAEKVAY